LAIVQPLSVESLATATLDVGAGIQLAQDRQFLEWRYCSARNEKYRYFQFARSGRKVSFVLRLDISRAVREVWIGQIRKHACTTFFLASALRALSRAVRRDPSIACLSLALLSPLPSTCLALAMAGFIPNQLASPLIVKPHNAIPGVIDRRQWRDTCLEDMDVW
jgi:hypothetical protein